MTAEPQRPTFSHEIGPEGVVHFRLHAGDVRLRAIAGETVHIREFEGRDLADRFHVERGSGSLTIRPHAQHGELGILLGGRRSTSLDVELPERATVVVATVSADVATTGLSGDQRYRTTSGDLRLDAAAGTIAVEAVSGSLVIRGAGDIQLIARLVSGSADVVATISRLTLTTTSGDVQLAGLLVGSGPFAIRTVSGEVRLATGSDIRVQARTLTGRIHSARPHVAEGRPGRQTVIVGGEGPTLTFDSVSGGLRVVEPAPPAPPAPPLPPRPITALEADDRDGDRLEILRALERGELDVAEATARLSALDDAAARTDRTAEGAQP